MPPVNIDELNEIMDNDEELIRECFEDFLEDYPDLKANENMMQLSEELTSTENRVAFARQSFNDGVMHYNTYKQSFPQNFFAGPFGHAADASLLEFEDSAEIQAPPKVSF